MGRMWKAGPLGAFGGRMTFRPFCTVKTFKTFDKGYAINGVHQPKFIQVDVTLDLSKGEMTCRSCGGKIKVGEIFGNGFFEFNGPHCVDCIAMPEGIEVVHVVYQVRKSKNRPDGIERVLVVHQRREIDEFVCALQEELKREVHVEVLPVMQVTGVTQ